MIYNPAFVSQFKQRYGDFGPNRQPVRQPIFGPGPHPMPPIPAGDGNPPPQFLGPPIHPPAQMPTEFGQAPMSDGQFSPNPTTTTTGTAPDGVMTTQPPSQLFARGGVVGGFQIGGAQRGGMNSPNLAQHAFSMLHASRHAQAPANGMYQSAALLAPQGPPDSMPPPAGGDYGLGSGASGPPTAQLPPGYSYGSGGGPTVQINPGTGYDANGVSYMGGVNYDSAGYPYAQSTFPSTDGSNYNGLGALYGKFAGIQGGPGATGSPGPGGSAVMAAHNAHQFRRGGVVPGAHVPASAPDSVPAMMKPGEVVLNERQQGAVMIRPGMKNRLRPDEVSAIYAAHMKR